LPRVRRTWRGLPASRRLPMSRLKCLGREARSGKARKTRATR
jgi:hypothetical protein